MSAQKDLSQEDSAVALSEPAFDRTREELLKLFGILSILDNPDTQAIGKQAYEDIVQWLSIFKEESGRPKSKKVAEADARVRRLIEARLNVARPGCSLEELLQLAEERFLGKVNQKDEILFLGGYDNIPGMRTNYSTVQSQITKLANSLGIPGKDRDAFDGIIKAFQEGGLRSVRNAAEKLERHATGKSQRKAVPSTRTFALLATVDFSSADPNDEGRVREAYRFVKAAQRLSAKNPTAITEFHEERLRAARRLIGARRSLNKATP